MKASRRALFGLWLAVSLTDVSAADEFRRPMVIHRLPEVGLEIWTEANPLWDTRVERVSPSGRVSFSAETPGQAYPPAGMTWTLSGLRFSTDEFASAARSAVDQAASNYGLNAQERAAIEMSPATYGSFAGFEAEFGAVAEGVPLDVRVFFGHQLGKPAVAMQVFTLRGKLPHLSEQIRRSWSNVRYLK